MVLEKKAFKIVCVMTQNTNKKLLLIETVAAKRHGIPDKGLMRVCLIQ